jgi:hypothetical protein
MGMVTAFTFQIPPVRFVRIRGRLYRKLGDFRVISMAPDANRRRHLFFSCLFFMAALTGNPHILVFLCQQETLLRPDEWRSMVVCYWEEGPKEDATQPGFIYFPYPHLSTYRFLPNIFSQNKAYTA